MASWMVHLRLADNLLDRIGGLDEEQFGIGNIAPDSGIPDEDSQSFTPPPKVSHFYAPIEAAFPSQDLEFYRRYLVDREPDEDSRRFSFLVGYFFHLLTDNLWHVKIDQPTRVRHADQFERDSDFIWEVKRDWYGLDFIYARAHPRAFFWRVFLNCEYGGDYLDFMPAKAVNQRLEYIKEFYQREDGRVEALLNRPFEFLTEAKVDTFVDKTTERLHQIYQLLWEMGSDSSENYASALEIPV